MYPLKTYLPFTKRALPGIQCKACKDSPSEGSVSEFWLKRYLERMLENNVTFNEIGKDLNKIKSYKDLGFPICKPCYNALLKDSNIRFGQYEKAGVPSSIVNLLVEGEISEKEMLILVNLFPDEELEIWAPYICKIMNLELKPRFYNYKSSFEACAKIVEIPLENASKFLMIENNYSKKEYEMILKLIEMKDKGKEYPFADALFARVHKGEKNDSLSLHRLVELNQNTEVFKYQNVCNLGFLEMFSRYGFGKEQVKFFSDLRDISPGWSKVVVYLADSLPKHSLAKVNSAMELYSSRGFKDQSPDLIIQVLDGANWKVIAVKNGFFQL